MTKKTPKIPDPLSQAPFRGVITPAFSLRTLSPGRSRTITTPSFGGAGVSRITLSGGDQPVLGRLSQDVPRAESALLGAAREVRPQIQSLRPQFSSLFGQSREQLQNLLGDVRPGFGAVTQARVQAIDRNRSRTLGNLREALGKRNVLGASFAQAEIRAADQEFAQLESEARAEAAVQEIELSQSIIQNITNLDATTFGALSESFKTELAQIAQEQSIVNQRAQRELQELGIAGGLFNQQQQIAANLAAIQAQLAGQAAADSGSLIGTFVGAGARLGAAFIGAPSPPPVPGIV